MAMAAGMMQVSFNPRSVRLQYRSSSRIKIGFSFRSHVLASRRKNLYEILGIKENVAELEVKEAYRRLAKVYHPDLAPPDLFSEHQGKFLEVQRAYDVLKDPRSRAEYDSQIESENESEKQKTEWRGFNWETDQCWTL